MPENFSLDLLRCKHMSNPLLLCTRWDTDTYPKEIGLVIVYEIEVDDLNYQTYYLHNQNAKEAKKEWIEQNFKIIFYILSLILI